MARLCWSGPALADLRAIRDYVSRDNPAAAVRLAKRLRERVLRLESHPLSGRVVPELGSGRFREVIVKPYRIVYEIQGDDLFILRVWHSRRELPKQL